MDFDEAVAAHVKWKIRLGVFLSGSGAEKLNPAEVDRDDLCELGKWIYGEGARHVALPEYTRLKAEHERLHHITARIVRSYLAGDVGEARRIFDSQSELGAASSEVVMAIHDMKRRVARR